jgi:broad specificity phosphatase PhoE
MKTTRAEAPPWEFKARFRRHAFGWKSQPAITRVRQAVAEISKVAKTRPLLAAEGAVTFLERVSPALEQVDSSSGAIGSAVSNAIADLVPLIAGAPADATTRAARDFAEKEPAFALGADVLHAYHTTLAVAERHGSAAAVKERIRKMIAAGGPGAGFVRQMLGRELGPGGSG